MRRSIIQSTSLRQDAKPLSKETAARHNIREAILKLESVNNDYIKSLMIPEAGKISKDINSLIRRLEKLLPEGYM